MQALKSFICRQSVQIECMTTHTSEHVQVQLPFFSITAKLLLQSQKSCQTIQKLQHFTFCRTRDDQFFHKRTWLNELNCCVGSHPVSYQTLDMLLQYWVSYYFAEWLVWCEVQVRYHHCAFILGIFHVEQAKFRLDINSVAFVLLMTNLEWVMEVRAVCEGLSE